jgi:CRISPR-associated endonuclease/helicase Cas3
MTTLIQPDEFGTFFKSVYGYPPFEWQSHLAHRVLSGGGWPQAVDVFTGMGKTALIDIAVFALAATAHQNPATRTAPTRTAFIVDRRVIVDQTFDRARTLAAALTAPSNDVVANVSHALSSLAGAESTGPLEVVRMRGGTTWDWRWLRSPDQPAVVVGTVDQLGSRLLFRGYGVGAKLRSLDAALVGADVLVVLDEAHLSQPFVDTLNAAHAYERTAASPALSHRHHHPVVLSATLRDDTADTFSIDSAAETSTTARARLDRRSIVTLVDLETTKTRAAEDLAEVLANVALNAAPGVERVLVTCNTVAVARNVFARMARAEHQGLIDRALLIGRAREVERLHVANTWIPRLAAAEDRLEQARPLVAVSTQTIEVGADLDVDYLVTEAAPIDALAQRLGRLNRLGRTPQAEAVVLHVAPRHETDPVYGTATESTWSWLVETAGPVTPVKPARALDAIAIAPSMDLGPLNLVALCSPDTRRELAARPAPSPVLLGPVLASWACTQPAPVPDQPVAPYLHGVDRGVGEVLVCWRDGLPMPGSRGWQEVWEAELTSTPVCADETVAVPVGEARRFLQQAATGQIADIDGVGIADDSDDGSRELIPAVVLRSDSSVHRATLAMLDAGVTLIVPSSVGGYDAWGWTGEVGGPAVADVADFAWQRHRPRLRLRGNAAPLSALRAAVADGDPADLRDLVKAALGTVHPDAQSSSYLVEVTADLIDRIQRVTTWRTTGTQGVVTTVGAGETFWLLLEGPRDTQGGFLPEQASDDTVTSSSAGWTPIGLARHLRDVAARAKKVGQRLGLSPELVQAVELAARAHDLGKADARFQVMLHGGDQLRAEAALEPLAKSGMNPADRVGFIRARQQSNLPPGFRHEAVSAKVVERLFTDHPALASDVDIDLVVHLVASHHGHSRPLLPPVLDPAPIQVAVELPDAGAGPITIDTGTAMVDWGGPARFDRLCRKYGWWGLALLEAILRLADIGCSEEYTTP